MTCNSARSLGGNLMHRIPQVLDGDPIHGEAGLHSFWASAKAHFSNSAKRFTPLLAPSKHRITGAASVSALLLP